MTVKYSAFFPPFNSPGVLGTTTPATRNVNLGTWDAIPDGTNLNIGDTVQYYGSTFVVVSPHVMGPATGSPDINPNYQIFAEGSDGTTLYTWIAYADSADGTSNFTTDVPGTRTYIGFAPNKESEVESTNPADYKWSKLLGPPGPSIVITPSQAGFIYVDGTLTPSPQTVTYTATLNGLSGTINWTTVPNIKSGTGTTFAINNTEMGNNPQVVVTATVGTAKQSQLLQKLADPNSDQTSINQAASIQAQGALATQNSVDFDTQVGGTGAPASNAGTTIPLISLGNEGTLRGNTLTRITGGFNALAAASGPAFDGPCFAEATIVSGASNIISLDDEPLGPHFLSHMFSFVYRTTDGVYWLRSYNNNQEGIIFATGTVAANQVGMIRLVYTGVTVKAYINSTLIAQTTQYWLPTNSLTPIINTLKLYPKWTAWDPGVVVRNINAGLSSIQPDLATNIIDSGDNYQTIPRGEIRTPLGTAASIQGQGPLATTQNITPGQLSGAIKPGPNLIFNPDWKLGFKEWNRQPFNSGTTPWTFISDWRGNFIQPPVGVGGTFISQSTKAINCAVNQTMTLSASFFGGATVNSYVFVDVMWVNGNDNSLIEYSSNLHGNGVLFNGGTYSYNDALRKTQVITSPASNNGSSFVKAYVRLVFIHTEQYASGSRGVLQVKLEPGANASPFSDQRTDGANMESVTGRVVDPTIYNTQLLVGTRSTTNLAPTYTAATNGYTVNLPAHYRTIAGPNGPINLFYGAGSGFIPYSTYWFAYIDDPEQTGNASPTINFTTDSNQLLYAARYSVAQGMTPSAGGTGGSTGSGGGYEPPPRRLNENEEYQ